MPANPVIVSRETWGANPLHTPAGTISTPAPELWLHHTGGNNHGASGMRALQSYARANGYVDLEYTYCVDTDGTLFMSRGIGHDTAATKDHNDRSHAICAMGNYEHDQPTDALLDGIVTLARYLYEQHAQTSAGFTGPHRDASGNATACCGHNLIAQLPALNHAIHAYGPTPGPTTPGGAVDITTTPSGGGYYVVDATGAVFCYGDAKYRGGTNGLKLAAPIVAMAIRPNNDGYWLAAADGGVFCFGNAPMKGSMGGKKLAAPVVSIAATDSGAGYWLLAHDGGVFAFGDALFRGAPTGMVHA